MRARALNSCERRLKQRRQRGVVAVVVAMTIVAMVGMVGLAIDLGQMFVAKTELQNAADACALAAARDMESGQPLSRSEAAGRTVAGMHRVAFQDNAIGGANAPVTITYSPTANGSFVSGAGLTGPAADAMKYVRCEITHTGIRTFFIQVLNVLPNVNIGNQSVSAAAVAALLPSQATCALPIGLCSSKVATASAGTWLEGVLDTAPGGDFRWLDLTSSGGGAAEISSQLLGEGACDLPALGTQVGKPGNMPSLGAAFNSRFGIYFGSVKPADADPDRSGYSYTLNNWPTAANAYYGDFTARRDRNEIYQGVAVTGIDVSGTSQSSSYLGTKGRQRRVVAVPVVDCTTFDGSAHKAPITGWACVFLLHPMANSAGGGAKADASPFSRVLAQAFAIAFNRAFPSAYAQGQNASSGGSNASSGGSNASSGGSNASSGGTTTTSGGTTTTSGGTTTTTGGTTTTSGGGVTPKKCEIGSDGQPRLCIEYLGNATSADSECASNGLPGDPTTNTPKVPTLVK